MIFLLFILENISSAHDARFWKNFGILAEKNTEKIPVDTVETIETLYEYLAFEFKNWLESHGE